jgi:hypothetical protein
MCLAAYTKHIIRLQFQAAALINIGFAIDI